MIGNGFVDTVGPFVHWLLKGCKTKLKDEYKGTLPATWGKSYDMENNIIGIISTLIIIAILVLLVNYNILK
jgi:hypothetical protein